MNKLKLKKIVSFLLILIGAVLLIMEIASAKKNYYTQVGGIICLMSGVFLINTNVTSRFSEKTTENQEKNEEE
ncbi:hypothetical protein SAMN04487910_0015 [Aquimarina amphilecti]|uniref:NfeD integral membrane domain-containing protein n=1 Tax=Aquimarina amphilecti TaxID=1038014 RepID=A0A1H7FHM1_AQUAM|nr:hypothetical protein [Aquimarina amphilecti]SEK22785.1 hypothetical protein SAMN04487910_0015 [Aquimarina amphilecti]